MSSTTASTADGGGDSGGGGGTPPMVSTTNGGGGGKAPALKQQYTTINNIRTHLKAQYNKLLASIKADDRDPDGDEQAKLEELIEQINAMSLQGQSLAYQINNNINNNNNNSNQATEARSPAHRIELPKLNPTLPVEDWVIYALQVRSYIKQLGFTVDGKLTTAQEASFFGMLLTGVKDANMTYLVTNDNPDDKGSVAWLSLQQHFASSSRAALTTLLNRFLGAAYQPEHHADFNQWLGVLMSQYERIMSIKDIKVSDVLLATCVNHLPNTAEWATFKNALLSQDDMTKTQFYTTVAAFQENERCRTTVNLQSPAATGPAVQGVAMLGTSSVNNSGHGAVRTEQPTVKTPCARCGGAGHMTDECRRTRGYSCRKCGGEHYENCCTSAGGQEQSFRQRRLAAPRGHGYHDQQRMPPMHVMQQRMPPMQFMQHGPHHMYAQQHAFPPHHGPPAHHVGGGGEPQQQPQQQQQQRPDGAGPGWGSTTF